MQLSEWSVVCLCLRVCKSAGFILDPLKSHCSTGMGILADVRKYLPKNTCMHFPKFIWPVWLPRQDTFLIHLHAMQFLMFSESCSFVSPWRLVRWATRDLKLKLKCPVLIQHRERGRFKPWSPQHCHSVECCLFPTGSGRDCLCISADNGSWWVTSRESWEEGCWGGEGLSFFLEGKSW